MQVVGPSPSQATDLMERHRRADGEAAMRMASGKERKRDELAKGYIHVCIMYKSRLMAGSGGAGRGASGGGVAGAPGGGVSGEGGRETRRSSGGDCPAATCSAAEGGNHRKQANA
jgi:hypothetical protein